ncbi:DUF2017 domain-containing protein [Leifsonia sp. Root112D2]|jgi:hypothetical protein|uniref:DUF2017 domain-containing protein n=1 Tax=Leifsonia sp. Root112D2 TaxID=1736426 RepID=UPI0006FD9DED|nr:DUF2017 domain-containing protein [Leifsonia sp. Root112D2]KQV05243.1 hypothetical protein ASC63_15840 [Leifsonia sp. Root112D2]
MSGFQRRRDGELQAHFAETERNLLASLAGQLIVLLEGASESATAQSEDPALLRLLPDAYPDDPEASAEFRRFTAEGITAAKIANAHAVIASLESSNASAPPETPLDDAAAQSWLRTLTDLRLTLAARLGIERDGDEGNRDLEAIPLQELYLWFGYLQESLLEALENRAG